MNALKRIRAYLLVCSLVTIALPLQGFAQQSSNTSNLSPKQAASERDEQHDFDFAIGTWKVHILHLQHPLTDSKTWTEFNGTVVVRKVWGGRSNLQEIEVDTPTGPIEELRLCLYNPQSHQWYLYMANSRDGVLSPPMIGEFKNGRGLFYDQEQFNGRAIFVRHAWSDITPNSYHWQQAFSKDGGKTWEPNWIVTVTREKHVAAKTGWRHAGTERGGQRDFDFEIGTWKSHIRRLLHPLTGSAAWVRYEGTTVVRSVWNGRANLAELEAGGPAGHLELLSLRLFNPQSRQWSLNVANSSGGTLNAPTIGEFKNGRDEFIDQESFNGRTILVRFDISDITRNAVRFDQAFSDDGGKTWEVNWVATDTRIKDESDKAH